MHAGLAQKVCTTSPVSFKAEMFGDNDKLDIVKVEIFAVLYIVIIKFDVR